MKRLLLFFIAFIFGISVYGQNKFTYPIEVGKISKSSGQITLRGITSGTSVIYVSTTGALTMPTVTLMGTDTIATKAYSRSHGGGGSTDTTNLSKRIDNATFADYVIYKSGAIIYAKPTVESGYIAYVDTNITSVLRRCINEVGTGDIYHRKIHIKAGLYQNMDSVYVNVAYVTIEGDGMYSTILKLKNHFDHNQNWGFPCWFTLGEGDYITFRDLQLDGNASHQVYHRIQPAQGCDGDTCTTARIWAIGNRLWIGSGWVQTDYTLVENCYLHNITQMGIQIQKGIGTIVRDCLFRDIGENPVTVCRYTSNSLIERCIIEGGGAGTASGGVGVSLYGTDNVAREIIVRNSTTSQGIAAGLGMEGGSGYGPLRNKFIDCEVSGNSRMTVGILMASYTRSCVIKDCKIDNLSYSDGMSMYIRLDSGSLITNNKISRCAGSGPAFYACNATTVSNNDFSTTGWSNVVLVYYGGLGTTNSIFRGNIITSPGHAPITFQTNCTNNIFMDNIINSNQPIGYNATATGTIWMNNYGVYLGNWLNTTGLFSTTATATSDGTTTGILKEGNQNVTVTSSNANYIVCLPAASAATIGTKVTGQVGANGFELRVAATQAITVYINSVTTNVEAAIPANSSFEVNCIDATHWILKAWTATGELIVGIIPDGV